MLLGWTPCRRFAWSSRRPQLALCGRYASSSVDPETEYLNREALGGLVENRTWLLITRRLSTIQNASKIVVMHKGRVREVGTHQELLAKRGIYFKLYQLQYKDQEASAVRGVLPVAGNVSESLA